MFLVGKKVRREQNRQSNSFTKGKQVWRIGESARFPPRNGIAAGHFRGYLAPLHPPPRSVPSITLAQVGWVCVDSAYDSVDSDPVKTRTSKSEAEAEEQINHNPRFQALWLVGSSSSVSDSDNIVFTVS